MPCSAWSRYLASSLCPCPNASTTLSSSLRFKPRFSEDFTEFVERVCSITAEGRDVLCLILADVDGSCSNGRFCCAACISLDGHGDVRGKTDGVVDFVLLVLGHVFIVAVFVVGGSDALCTVIRLVLQIANSTFLFFLDLLKPFFANM